MFNLANNVKVTWKEVPGAKYYKVYREGVTDKKELRKELVAVLLREKKDGVKKTKILFWPNAARFFHSGIACLFHMLE